MTTSIRFTFLILVLVSQVNGQDARAIIQHYIDTVSGGDVKNWSAIKTMYAEGQSYYSHNDFEQKTSLIKPDVPSYFRNWVDLNTERNRDELFSDSSFEIRTSAFYYFKDKVIILIGNLPAIKRDPFEKNKFMSRHLPVYVANILKHSNTVELIDTKQLQTGGPTLYELKMTAEGKPYYLFINADTFLLEYYDITGNNDRSVISAAGEYRQFGNLLVPMFESTSRNNVVYFWSRKGKLTLNAEIDPAILEYKEK